MKREEKNALSRQRILEAALEEFSCKGYDGASLNTVWTKKGISKGIIYHYFKDKDELYLLCVEACFDALTEYLKTVSVTLSGPARKQLQEYFDARLSFFSVYPLYLGIFADAVFRPPAQLLPEITVRRKAFDELNISVLTKLLRSENLRAGLSVDTVVEDFRIYMDYFNMRFQMDFSAEDSLKDILDKHEERCHQQLDILLYGVLGEHNES